MATEVVNRLQSGKIYFYPETDGVYGEAIPLAAQTKVTLKRSSEKKEVLSNDTEINETTMELVTKSTYEFSTEIGDISAANLALAFRGTVSTKTYQAGDVYMGKTIIDDTVAGTVGAVVIHTANLYIVKEAYAAGAFATTKCTPPRNAMHYVVSAENGASAIGKIVVDGVNKATNKASILTIPRINLSFDGDVTISGTEFIKLAFSGKILKKAGEPIFKMEDEA